MRVRLILALLAIMAAIAPACARSRYLTRAAFGAGQPTGTMPPTQWPQLPLPAGTTFDAAGADAQAVFSNGDRTLANPTANGAAGFVRSMRRVSAGRYYAEVTVEAIGSGGQIGLADDAVAPGANGSLILANNSRTIGLTMDGNIYNGDGFGTIGHLGSSVATGDVIGLAIDMGSRRLWVRKNGGAWNNSGTANPVTGSGGFVWNAALTGPVHLAMGAHQGARLTLNPTPDVRPSGFSGWLTTIPIDVLIVAGQSNAAGAQTKTAVNYMPDPNVLTWNGSALVAYQPNVVTGFDFNLTGRWAAELRYIEDYRLTNPMRPLAVLKWTASGTQLHASGSTAIFDWSTGSPGELFDNGGYQLRAALSALNAAGYEPSVRLMWWQQGENDTNATMAPNYHANLTSFVAGLRDGVGGWALPATARIAIGRLSSRFGNATYRDQIRAAEKAVADADIGGVQGLIDIDDLMLEPDYTHLTGTSQRTLGDRLWLFDAGLYPEP